MLADSIQATPTDVQNSSLPLVAAQPGIWLAEQLSSHKNLYVIAHYADIKGKLNSEYLCQAIRQGLAEADTIHARFAEGEEGPIQDINQVSLVEIPPVKLHDFSDDPQAEEKAHTLMQQDCMQEIPLDGSSPLYQHILICLEKGEKERWFWYQRYHHLVLDGFSFSALTRRMCELYQAQLNQQQPTPTPFTDFSLVVEEYQHYQQSAKMKEDQQYWQQYCANIVSAVTLSTKKEVIVAQPGILAHHSKNEIKLAELEQYSQVNGRPRFSTADLAVASIFIYLWKWSKKAQICVGFPFMRRMGSQAISSLGAVVNVLPIQLTLSPTKTWRQIAVDLNHTLKQVRPHQHYEVEQLRRDLGLSGSHRPLYHAIVNLKLFDAAQQISGNQSSFHTLSAGPIEDLEFELTIDDERFIIDWRANPQRYQQEELDLHSQRLDTILQYLLQNPDAPIADIPWLAQSEQLLLQQWSKGEQRVPLVGQRTILDYFYQQVNTQPQAIAVTLPEHQMSYQNLAEQAAQFARHLIYAQHINSGDLVAIALPHSLQKITAILAVMMSGATCLLLEEKYQQGEVKLIDEIKLIISLEKGRHYSDSIPVLYLDNLQIQQACRDNTSQPLTDAERSQPLVPESIACLFYSTEAENRDKPLMISHASLHQQLLALQSEQQNTLTKLQRQPRVGCITSAVTDEIWSGLFWMMLGAKWVLLDEKQCDTAEKWVATIDQYQLDILDTTPVILTQLMSAGLLQTGHYQQAQITLRGKEIANSLWQQLRQYSKVSIYYYYTPIFYGSGLCCSIHSSEMPVAGHPLVNSEVYLLDESLSPVPIGMEGELYFSNTAIKNRYFKLPDVTASHFIANPFKAGTVMYRSGDKMRWSVNGQLLFAELANRLLIIQGHYIDAQEIEQLLEQMAGVKQAAVVIKSINNQERLVAYCTILDPSLQQQSQFTEELRQQLNGRLAEYMIPTHFVILPELPLTHEGKVNQQLLPEPDDQLTPQQTGTTDTVVSADLICQAMAKILHLEQVNPNDDFFLLGGDSISAMSLSSALRRQGYQLKPKEIFSHRNAQKMAQVTQPLLVEQTKTAQQLVLGKVGATPIIRWFAEKYGLTSRFAHGVFLSTSENCSLENVQQILVNLMETHPMLHAKVEKQELHLTPFNLSMVEQAVTNAIVPDHADLKQYADELFPQIVQQLDPQQGKMARLVLLTQQNQSRGLILVLHHLVTDGISWRILLEDLRQSAEAITSGQEITLAKEDISMHEWALLLRQNISAKRQELPLWRHNLQAEALMPPPINQPVPHPIACQQQRWLLDADLTQTLFSSLPELAQCRTDEILCGMLALAYCIQFSGSSLRISLESHGRPDHLPQGDLGRTVGWFTAEYPVLFDFTGKPLAELHSVLAATPSTEKQQTLQNSALMWSLRRIKQALHVIPDLGIGFGVLRYLDEQSQADMVQLMQSSAPFILFNYLGRFHLPQEGKWLPQTTEHYFRDTFAVEREILDTPLYGLELNIFIDESTSQSQLAFNWSWDPERYQQTQIEQLQQNMLKLLQPLAKMSQESVHWDTLVPADIALADISEHQLDKLRLNYGPLEYVLPLLPLQEGLLFHATMAQGSGGDHYNCSTLIELHGELDTPRLQQSLSSVIKRHPQLLAKFDSELASRPMQLISAQSSYTWPFFIEDISDQAEDEQEEYILQQQKQELSHSLFNQQGQPLLKAILFRQQEDKHTLLLVIHHLITDGWSTPILLKDLFTCYQQPQQPLPSLIESYKEIIHQLNSQDLTAARECWSQGLQQVSPTCLFPTAETDGSSPVEELTLRFNASTTAKLTQLCRQSGITLNTFMQGIWALWLSMNCGRQDVVFGSPVSGRMSDISNIDAHVGLFSNTLPVRVTLDWQQPLTTQLAILQQQQIQRQEHDGISLAEIQQLVGVSPLFDTLLVVENYPDAGKFPITLSETLQCTAIQHCGHTHYPLTLLVLPGQELQLILEYREQVSYPQQIMLRLRSFIEQVIKDPLQPLSSMSLILPAEDKFIRQINQTKQDVTLETLNVLLQKQAEKTPEALALSDSEHQLSYAEVRRQVHNLTYQLVKAGVRHGDIVAVSLTRSVRLSIALMAIIEAGAAYLPLDSGYPDDRLLMMLEDAQPRILMTEEGQKHRFEKGLENQPQTTIFNFTELPQQLEHPTAVHCQVTAVTPAYIIYTSGSTGRPKGVVINHQAIVNRLLWMQHQYSLNETDVVLQKTPCSFDVSVWEFFWPLIVGAQLVMAPADAHRDPLHIAELIRQYHVTTMHFVPSMLAAFVQAMADPENESLFDCRSLKRVFCSGEALSRDLSLLWEQQSSIPLHNLYGPTEAAVDVTYHPAWGTALAACKTSSVPIGKPVWNTELRILDQMLRPVPPGVAGDLYLCGRQLAIGYLNRPELTASRFVADPFADGERMYQTGDVARWLEDGTVEYLGRSDHQIKIRGQRVELGDIEQALLACPGVAQAAVHACVMQAASGLVGADNRQLIGYVTATEQDSPPVPEQLLQILQQQLPAHMVPVHIMLLKEFPLSANGKLDRKALPIPQPENKGQRRPLKPGLETELAALYSELLGVETIYADDDFFALGGHSLLAMRLSARLRQTLQRSLTVAQVMGASTVEKLALLLSDEHLLNQSHSDAMGTTLVLREGKGPALFCIHPASGFSWPYRPFVRYLSGQYPIIGLQSPRPQGIIASSDTMEEACERHLALIRSHQPHGPYYLLGYSFGGTVAQAIAVRLQQQGEQVAWLGLLDTYPPEGQDWSESKMEVAEQEAAEEHAAFMAESEEMDDQELQREKQAMFEDIVANYQDAVRLLSKTKTPVYHGKATLFVATRTLPEGLDVNQHWQPYIKELQVYYLDCEHANIIDMKQLPVLGPIMEQEQSQHRK